MLAPNPFHEAAPAFLLPSLLGGCRLHCIQSFPSRFQSSQTGDGLTTTEQFAAIPSPLSEDDEYHIHPDKIAEEISRGVSVILTSNPRNPTGQVVANPELVRQNSNWYDA